MTTHMEKLQSLKDDSRIIRAWTSEKGWHADLEHGLVDGDNRTHSLFGLTFESLARKLRWVSQCNCLGCQLGKMNSDDLLEMYRKANEADPFDRVTSDKLTRIINY